ncbi:unnamed protein product [Polarella glacialis]|uniref:glutamate--cysteine ligase n=1 Tax=Polarella glacialis TaxID=89957 RepID=A0A813EAD7_POLGL|nr:unnamed protein product [Polarella glacialis]
MPLDKSRIQGFGSDGPGQSEASSASASAPSVSRKCPAGHALQIWTARPGWCDGCGNKIRGGDAVMDCRTCNYYLCKACCPLDEAAADGETPSFWGAIASLTDSMTSGPESLTALLAVEGMGGYDVRDPSAVAAQISRRLREHWAQRPPLAARGPILVTQGDPLTDRGISAITRAVAAELKLPRALVCLDEAIDATHAPNADRHGVVIELRYGAMAALLESDAACGEEGGSPYNSNNNNMRGRSLRGLTAAVEAALQSKNEARNALGKPPLASYYREYALLQEVTKAAARLNCGGITVAHTASDISPFSVTSFCSVGLAAGLVDAADMVPFDVLPFYFPLELNSMGLLKVGTPLSWKDSLEHLNYIREHGVLQFIATYNRLVAVENDTLLYGDEIEYGILKLDRVNRKARISLQGSESLEFLRSREQNIHQVRGCSWHQEYGSWMIESTPSQPYAGYTASLVSVEQNMRLRRGRLISALGDDEIAPTMVAFPQMGVDDFVHPPVMSGGPASESEFISDSCINPHPRFGTLTGNIRRRRGSKVDIRVPLFKDVKTPEFENLQEGGDEPSIHMDCMAFGMGCCCLQVTFQGSNLDESRYLYDQLAGLAPIMMALTAATPILKGRLAGIDARWTVISQSVDDRTPAERGEAVGVPDPRMAGGGVTRLCKSRYDSISSYIHPSSFDQDSPSSIQYNDVPCEIDEKTKDLLLQNGIDAALSHHMGHLFTRDPLVSFEGNIQELDDEQSTDHFESIQSTNWQTVRWKPPPVQSGDSPHIGWRTEFRSMEVQMTDFENAAFTAFIVIVTRAILVFNLTLLMPISKVDENMRRAHCVDAVNKQKFWFRNHILPDDADEMIASTCPQAPPRKSGLFEEMTMDEIMNGKSCYYPGLVPLCYTYLEHIGCDCASFSRIDQYLKLISRRASGELLTPATWMRNFVQAHPDYKQDSVVSDSVAFDLVEACNEIGLGTRPCREVLGNMVIDPICKAGQYSTPLSGDRMGNEDLRKVLKNIMSRAEICDGFNSAPSQQSLRRQCSPSAREGTSGPCRGTASPKTRPGSSPINVARLPEYAASSSCLST